MSEEKKFATLTTLAGLSLMMFVIWVAGFFAQTLPQLTP